MINKKSLFLLSLAIVTSLSCLLLFRKNSFDSDALSKLKAVSEENEKSDPQESATLNQKKLELETSEKNVSEDGVFNSSHKDFEALYPKIQTELLDIYRNKEVFSISFKDFEDEMKLASKKFRVKNLPADLIEFAYIDISTKIDEETDFYE